jgi:hypothetical protein
MYWRSVVNMHQSLIRMSAYVSCLVTGTQISATHSVVHVYCAEVKWGYFTTDGQSVDMSCYRVPFWDLRPDITSCRNVAVWNLRSCFCGVPSSRQIRHSTETRRQISDSNIPTGICGLVSVECLLWREDGSAIYSVITQWSESLRTRSHTLLSHLRLSPPRGPRSRIYIPREQGGSVIPLGTEYILLFWERYRCNQCPGA